MRYQATQEAGRPLFRKRKIWAAFVCPAKGETMFIGLFDAELAGTRKADWLCDYRGDAPGFGEPVDIFNTRQRPELAEHTARLRVDWPDANRRSWVRKAERLTLPISAVQPAAPAGELTRDDLIGALGSHGFSVSHSTKKLMQLRRGDLIVYVKRETDTRALVAHPHFVGLADKLRAIVGIDVPDPARTYVNSNLRAFPAYADHRASERRHGFAIGIGANRLGTLLGFLQREATIATPDGEVRTVASEDNPLTERERLSAARIGQGEFRDALLIYWGGACPVARVDHGAILRASHIKAWSESSNVERLDPFNGILLCAHIDALFDRHLITFEDDGRLRISTAVSAENRARLGLLEDMTIGGLDPRHAPYLAHHRAQFLR
ncbi:HNH endonuclease [Bradyrhizobium sp. JYMT SZCCT0428]|nr:HNH endonuclease [Bradyrhizobium sp. JYMT SZCCT0428]